MRCKTCDYPLWNLKSRSCPECGTAFRPSEFEFAPNTVRFCCPACQQEYYGTGPKGHLVPTQFRCVSCGQAVAMDDCVLLPAAGVDESGTKGDTNPWVDHAGAGRFRGWLLAVVRGLFQPGRLILATPLVAPMGWVFAMLTQAAFLAVGWGLLLLFVLVLVVVSSRGAPAPALGVSGGFGIIIVMMTAGYLLLIGAWAPVTHGLLRLTGPVPYPLRRTVQAVCYSSGANAVIIVPLLGIYLVPVGLVWWAVSATLMVRRAQNVSGVRAALVTLPLPGLVLLGGVAGVLVSMFTFMSNMSAYTNPPGAAGGPAGPPRPSGVTGPVFPTPVPPVGAGGEHAPGSGAARVLSAVMQYRQEHAGQWPFHAIELVGKGVMPADLGPDLTIAGVKVEMVFLDTDPRKMDQLRELVRIRCPGAMLAHRLGPYVFTYHGIPEGADGGLWVMVEQPAKAGLVARAWTLDGRMQMFASEADFMEALVEQNKLRVEAKLGALPSPATVGVDTPVAALP